MLSMSIARSSRMSSRVSVATGLVEPRPVWRMRDPVMTIGWF
jgi:hypothetical protein